MISYKKLLDLCEQRRINSYTFKKNKLIGEGTWANIKAGKMVGLGTIDKLCEFLNVQPGDILEYVPSPEKEEDK